MVPAVIIFLTLRGGWFTRTTVVILPFRVSKGRIVFGLWWFIAGAVYSKSPCIIYEVEELQSVHRTWPFLIVIVIADDGTYHVFTYRDTHLTA